MLASLFSSRVRAKILTQFFLNPGAAHHALALTEVLQENYSAVWKELIKLERLGILQSQFEGHAKIYQINSKCPVIPELRSLVLKTEGVGGVLQKHLQSLGNIKEAFIYGSFASGEADGLSDIDVMIIGDVELEQLSFTISTLEKELNRSINYLIFSEQEWQQKVLDEEPFALNVEQSPKIQILGGINGL